MIALIIIGIVAILAITYLLKIGVLGKAKAKIGAGPFTFELDMQSKERQISEKDFNKALVNLNEFYADSDVGFVIHKPFSEEWRIMKLTCREKLKQKGLTDEAIDSWETQNVAKDPDKNIHILAIRRGQAQSIRYIKETTENGQQLDLERFGEILARREEVDYDEIIVAAIRKDATKSRIGLIDLFFTESPILTTLGPKKLFANPENTVFLIDCSALFENIEYNGERGDHAINNVMLFQENNEYFFEVMVGYVQTADKPTKVWDELRNYLKSFRVLVK